MSLHFQLSFNITTEVSKLTEESQIKNYFTKVYSHRRSLCIGDIAYRIARGVDAASTLQNITPDAYKV